jgi:N-acyl amino acid synthase of PEP-CTERM/exosortase system
MLAAHFERYFEILPADDASLQSEVFSLRYQVYCEELGYEDPAAFPDGRETDAFDARSVHALLRQRDGGRGVACVRLVLDAPGAPFPFEQACGDRLDRARLNLGAQDRGRSGEISRLAVHRDFRRRRGEWQTPEATGEPEDQTGGQRQYPLLPMSLFLAAAALAMNRGLDQVFVMMEPRLARLLASCGIRFEPVGPVIEYHGRRGPFRITHAELDGGLPAQAQTLLARMRGWLA